ncbi:type III-B CRISPR-associated protein Cas10/Cmr2 [Nodosilinea sp. E11]|uniref:type III-B CRISPR-associated protein Cas10/Cmr2 n=1 Tax=Nodosilinea sp. E11 TaxID=3037479 RepID=UPI0029343D70|nr:type III-B CRISPR-associated protein Cas10/Cmr2 [Nodosilinea sp. E11]WOD37194.1 type III-B CRISPR-associated protein Cas10/Cmr2 [Nodosilinea sp. E11]
MTDYQRKLYAFLQAFQPDSDLPNQNNLCSQLDCLKPHLEELSNWWNSAGKVCQDIGASSDRINLHAQHSTSETTACHPISGQQQTWPGQRPAELAIDISPIQHEADPKKVFWWFWRFYPELWAKDYPNALLHPAHSVLPDCPLHSHQSTVSALAGAMFPLGTSSDQPETPYLLLFSFSPVQDFIKASRKFLDFWAGSYLLHYLSARLCWYIAQEYGPDAVIVPSLWNQEIFDALMLRDDSFSSFEECFKAIAPAGSHKTPVERFNHRESNSLSTAGFPNMITVLVPGKAEAEKLGQKLAKQLAEEWRTISNKIRDNIRTQVIAFLTEEQHQARRDELWREFDQTLPSQVNHSLYRQEAELLKQQNCWEWRHLWDAQIDNTWEPYWAAVPLGHPAADLLIKPKAENDPTWPKTQQNWADQQSAIAWPPTSLPSEAEKAVYQQELNVGTWWGSLQQRLRTAHMAVKNTRHWQIPAAPGPRSSLSGQFSALHPRLNYQERRLQDGTIRDFREGGGLPDSSMRLFWLLMSYAYKGLFNGSEMLNALELTKRMAWQFGGVADSMGIPTTLPVLRPEDYDNDDQTALNLQESSGEIDYEQLIRFPNLSSIAAARFIYESYQQPNSKLKAYWRVLRQKIGSGFENAQHQAQFAARTRGRPTHVWKTDHRINPSQAKRGHNYNGVMFSSKWLADDLNLEKHATNDNEVTTLRRLVDEAHRHDEVNFGDGSPGDWWVIVLGDGDGMGNYISGEELKAYRRYVNAGAIDKSSLDKDTHPTERDHLASLLKKTQKRMGPATHIGLNRALLDFSNRLVPYLTEKRYCGRVIYSGGDDVMAVLPLEDLPGYLRSLRAAWSGMPDPEDEFTGQGGYWHPNQPLDGIPQRPLFTMGKDATMSLGIVIANKAVPLPTVLESLWDAEKTAKAMPGKDGLCFRVIYGGGNTLEALMKGDFLNDWWAMIETGMKLKKNEDKVSPILYRLAEELPKRASITPSYYLFAEAAKVIAKNRDESSQGNQATFEQFCQQLDQWLRHWEDWAREIQEQARQAALNEKKSPEVADQMAQSTIGTRPEDIGYLLRFSAFWVSKNAQRQAWVQPQKQTVEVTS